MKQLDDVKAVIFDLDGTLVDSMWMWETIDIEFLGKYGYSCPPELQKTIEGMGFTETAVYFKERFSLPLSIEEIKQIWTEMSIDKYRNAVLESLGVRGFFQVVTTACEVNAGKPAPDIYLYVAEKLGVKPEDCMVFEDVPAGILAGKRAGMTVYAIEDEFSRKMEAEKRELADGYIRDYFELLGAKK